MGAWERSSLFEYYDANTDVVAESATRLRQLDASESATALATVAATVRRLTDDLTGERLGSVAVSVADDLYKTTATWQGRWAEEETNYLRSVYATFFEALTQRGLTIRYIVENTYPDLARPLIFFPLVYRQLGLVYACPHHLAWDLAKHDVPTFDGLLAASGGLPSNHDLAPWLKESRHVVATLAAKAIDARRHLMYLELDYKDGALDPILTLPAAQGVITIFRNEPPNPHTRVRVIST
jgi:hypothetical protein